MDPHSHDGKKNNLDRNLPPPNYDWTDPEFAGIMITYLIFGCLYAIHHMLIQWVISSWTNDPVMLARYAGLFKGILSAGLCVGFDLEAAGVSYMVQDYHSDDPDVHIIACHCLVDLQVHQ